VLYLFVLWNIISAFWSADLDMTLDRLLTYFQLAGLIWLLWDLYTTPAALKAGLQAYVLGAYVSVGSTVYNYLVGSELHYRRYAASGFNPDDIGTILALGIPLAWYLAVAGGNDSMVAHGLRVVNYAYVPAATFAVLLTATRGALIATSAAFLFVLGSLTRLKPFARVLIFTALVGALFAVHELVPQTSFQRLATLGTSISTADLHGRVDIWRAGLAVFSANPLLGIGSGAYFTAVGVGKVAHNTFISVLVEVGMIGWILFAIILVMTVYQVMHQPKLEARLWLTVLLVWALTASFMTWEQRKQTWLFLSLAIVSANLSVQRDESSQRQKFLAESIELPKGE
jgi:O-antigen ligase